MDGLIPCHTCGAEVKLARSVKLRDWGQVCKQFEGLVEQYPNPNDCPIALYEQYKRQAEYRRAFVCERCYKLLDGSGNGIGDNNRARCAARRRPRARSGFVGIDGAPGVVP